MNGLTPLKGNAMKSTAQKTYLAGIVVLVAGAVCAAQDWREAPVITVTAGQGGYIALPDIRPAPQRFALTGDQDGSRQSARVWQSVVGPRYRVGQAEITLPAAR
jgi:hypothetical protein